MLDKQLAYSEKIKIEPIIIVNKCDLKDEYKEFIEYKHLFPEKFDDIEFKLKSEIENYHYKQQLPEYQRKFYDVGL